MGSRERKPWRFWSWVLGECRTLCLEPVVHLQPIYILFIYWLRSLEYLENTQIFHRVNSTLALNYKLKCKCVYIKITWICPVKQLHNVYIYSVHRIEHKYFPYRLDFTLNSTFLWIFIFACVFDKHAVLNLCWIVFLFNLNLFNWVLPYVQATRQKYWFSSISVGPDVA